MIQGSDELNVSIQTEDGTGKEIPRYMLQGLPKMNKVPQEFFDQCYATVSENSVRFSGRLKGGGGSDDEREKCRKEWAESERRKQEEIRRAFEHASRPRVSIENVCGDNEFVYERNNGSRIGVGVRSNGGSISYQTSGSRDGRGCSIS